MKLHLTVLEKLIELPSKEISTLRQLIDESVGDVKDVETEPHVVFTVETLANRADNACALGVARELSARLLTAIKHPELAANFSDKKPSVSVKRETEKCLRYALLELSLPKGEGKSSGIRPEIKVVCGDNEERAPIVHVLNYVQLELGQPMHAFDRSKIEGAISVVESTKVETIKALDGKEYKIPVGSILIKDAKKTIAVAGVIGCENSMVTPETTVALIESATFDPVTVRKAARGMGIATDASFIFERGADYDNVVTALRRAVLLAGTPGNLADPLGFVVLDGALPKKPTVSVSLERARAELALPRIGEDEIVSRLRNLGFKTTYKEKEKLFECEVPSWRYWDVVNSSDLVEEIVRSVGYSRITLKLPALDPNPPKISAFESLREKVEVPLIAAGFYEVMTKSYYSKEEVSAIGALDPKLAAVHVEIINAIESGNSHMKISNIPHLARVCDQNVKRGLTSVKIFEFGKYFGVGLGGEDEVYPHEREYFTLATTGRWSEGEWKKEESTEEMLAAFKGMLAQCARSIGRELEISKTQRHPLLHPGAQCGIKIGNLVVGYFGLANPVLLARLGVKSEIIFAELDVEKLTSLERERERNAVSLFPAVRRDFTVKIGKKEYADKIMHTVRDLKLENLTDVTIVDDFTKEGEDFRRVSFRVTFQSNERTLESKAIDAASAKIIGKFEL